MFARIDTARMTYREVPPRTKAGRDVEVRSFLDLVAAELAALQLREGGVPAFVIEATSFNPALALSAGGHRVMVDAADLERADHLLRRTELAAEAPDDEPAGTVRCPRCELPYCRHSRPSLRGFSYSLSPIVALLALFAWPVLFLVPKRWRCETCGHVWDRADEGPTCRTVLEANDLRPVFVISRDHAGVGVVIGILFGLIETGVYAAAPAPTLLPLWIAAPFAVTLLGTVIGRRIGRFVCSAPGCAAELTPDAETCGRCHGTVAGRVKSRAEHFAAAAEVRREIAAAGDEPSRSRRRRAKRPLRRAA